MLQQLHLDQVTKVTWIATIIRLYRADYLISYFFSWISFSFRKIQEQHSHSLATIGTSWRVKRVWKKGKKFCKCATKSCHSTLTQGDSIEKRRHILQFKLFLIFFVPHIFVSILIKISTPCIFGKFFSFLPYYDFLITLCLFFFNFSFITGATF